MRSFFSGLRGRLTLTYTLVTVLALMALEVMGLSLAILFSNLNHQDRRSYLNDVIYTLYPQAAKYLEPGKQDLPGLQDWLEGVAKSGRASLPPQYAFDSPAAIITTGTPLLVVAPDQKILAQVPRQSGSSLVGQHSASINEPAIKSILERALKGNMDSLALSNITSQGKMQLAVPILQSGQGSEVLGAILLTVEPAPPMIWSQLPVYLGWVMGTGLLLLMAVAPFGALFGFVMSRGLSRRLTTLTHAADLWSEGNFQPLPVDRSRDEIGVLGMRLRNMAERIENLLHTQQQLAILEERNRLARDLHDTVKQQSFATHMQIRAARNLLHSDPAAAEKHLEEAEGLIKTSQEELNLLITELRPAALEDQGLTVSLRVYLKTWQEQTRILQTFQVTGERRLPLALEQALFRVSQEALSNVARHSHASAVSLLLEFQPELVRLEITDNGVGFDPRQVNGHGFGLESMRARLAEFGGWLVIEKAPEQGTQVAAVVPVNDIGRNGDAHRKN